MVNAWISTSNAEYTQGNQQSSKEQEDVKNAKKQEAIVVIFVAAKRHRFLFARATPNPGTGLCGAR